MPCSTRASGCTDYRRIPVGRWARAAFGYPASVPAKICQASADLATRLSVM